MPAEIQLRTADVGDEGRLAQLCANVQTLHAEQRPDVFKETDVAALEVWFRAVLAEKSATIWICDVGGAAVGYVLIRQERRPENVFCHPRHWCEIDQISVQPEFQQHGIARALLERVAEFATAEGVHEVELNTWHFNEQARSAFAKLGFNVKTLKFSRRVPLAKAHRGHESR